MHASDAYSAMSKLTGSKPSTFYGTLGCKRWYDILDDIADRGADFTEPIFEKTSSVDNTDEYVSGSDSDFEDQL